MSRRFEVERPREKNIPIEPSFSDVFCAYGQYDTEFRNSGLNRDIFFQIAPTKDLPWARTFDTIQ
jgi:hypothetical protein